MSDRAVAVSLDDEPIEILTVDDVADMLRVSRSTVYRFVRQGEIEFMQSTRGVRFTRAMVREFIRSHTVPARTAHDD
jgi:excisionase family DNA binding protein